MDNQSPATTVTFSLTVYHAGLLSQINQETGISKSEIIRKAIEVVFAKPELIATIKPALDE